MNKNKQLLQKVAEVYGWIENQTQGIKKKTGGCSACGQCCDFDDYDHRLFLTPPELIYMVENVGRDNLKPMVEGKCPYLDFGQCTIYSYRFAGCRIFNCLGEDELQSEICEKALKEFKLLCEEHDLDYMYMDLATALDEDNELFTGF